MRRACVYGSFRRSLDRFQLFPSCVELRELFLRGGEVGGELAGLRGVRAVKIRLTQTPMLNFCVAECGRPGRSKAGQAGGWEIFRGLKEGGCCVRGRAHSKLPDKGASV